MKKMAKAEVSSAHALFSVTHMVKYTLVCQKRNECDGSKKDYCMIIMANTC